MLKHPTQVKPSSLANDALVVHELLHEALGMSIDHANDKKWNMTSILLRSSQIKLSKSFNDLNNVALGPYPQRILAYSQVVRLESINIKMPYQGKKQRPTLASQEKIYKKSINLKRRLERAVALLKMHNQDLQGCYQMAYESLMDCIDPFLPVKVQTIDLIEQSFDRNIVSKDELTILPLENRGWANSKAVIKIITVDGVTFGAESARIKLLHLRNE